MSAEQFSSQHEEADLAHTINLNYERLLQARSDGSCAELQETFELRMNQALESYGDLLRFAGKAVLQA